MENSFNFVNMNSNDNFSDFDGADIQELIYQLDKYYLELRDKLNFNPNITFGLELEHENISKISKRAYTDKFYRLNLFNEDWRLDEDGSLNNGFEIISPILKDTIKNWKDLSVICEFINKYAEVGPHTAGHVHVGTQVLGYKLNDWLKFLKLWAVYENIIYRFTYGEYLTKLFGITYCEPYAVNFLGMSNTYNNYSYLDIESLIGHLSRNRSQAVNFQNVDYYSKRFEDGNTIEFRCPNGSLNPVVWQNNVNLFISLLKYSKSKNFDFDTIEKRNLMDLYAVSSKRYKLYDQIFLPQAIEFCDLVFKKNIDKIYFLKQYLKGFETDNYTFGKIKKTSEFTKIKK